MMHRKQLLNNRRRYIGTEGWQRFGLGLKQFDQDEMLAAYPSLWLSRSSQFNFKASAAITHKFCGF
jgi:hypothetical protein